jgi:hypothetical protein
MEIDVMKVLNRVFEALGVTEGRLPDQSNLAAVQAAARQMSLAPAYSDTVIVVIELGSEFNVETGTYVRRRYLHYPFREAADYQRIVCLKAAYRNGRRIDTADATETPASATSMATKIFRNEPPEATLVWGKPGRWAVRVDEQRSFSQS